MDFSEYIKDNEVWVSPVDERISYTGRINYNSEGEPEMIFAASEVRFNFKGTGAAVVVSSKRFYWDAFAGCMADGRELVFKLPEDGTVRLELGENLPDVDHSFTFFKRMDACNNITVHGFIFPKEAELKEPPTRPERRIEVYGDSVSAGEVSEAIAYVGKNDPEGHNGYYSNSRYSYSAILARKLNAELHDIAQGGISLMPGTGWFAGPDYIGMEQIWDKIKYYPDLEHATKWDFEKYTPHVVIVAFGQNDANPEDFMKNDYDGELATTWRRRYRAFLMNLREKYPKALIICTTTILGHDPAWDRAIDEVVKTSGDGKIKHFFYSKNGCGTSGHIRIPEAEQMAKEIGEYIESFGGTVWE